MDKDYNEPAYQHQHQRQASEQCKGPTAESWGATPSPPPPMELSVDNVEEVFRYHPWDSVQVDRGAQVTDALIAAAKVILCVVPRCPARTRALNHLQDARMVANHAITHSGRF